MTEIKGWNTMTERRDFIALDWVAGEIGETLKQADQALDAYIANRDDATKLRFCLSHIHQVHGTLQIVEFFGAALLAEEMEGLAQALTQGTVHTSHIDDALMVLKNTIVQLPRYLERVQENRHGLPAALLPVLNDLRAVRGESLLSETVLFNPDMSSMLAIDTTAKLKISSAELIEVAQKLRQMFQIALLGFMRGRDIHKNLNYLAKVCARLVKLTEGFPPQALWRVCIAVLEGLLNESIASSIAVKILLRQVDRQVKIIIEQGESALSIQPPEDLIKNLLYYVARSKANSRFIKEIKAQYNLDASLLGADELDDETLVTADAESMRLVAGALLHELNDIKQAFTAAGANREALTEILPLLRRVSDTLAILGMGTTLKQIQEPYSQLTYMLEAAEEINSANLQQIIEQLGKVDTDLIPTDMVPEDVTRELFNDSEEAQEHLDRAFASVVIESRNGLEQVKEAIIEFVATQWNHNCIIDIPDLLAEISGSLRMIPLAKAADILVCCERYIRNELLTIHSIPEWQKLDTLADAITSIDYYLERLADDSGTDGETILAMAADSVAELGYSLDSTGSNRSTDFSAQVLTTPEEQHRDVNEELETPLHSSELAPLERDGESVASNVVPFQLPSSDKVGTSFPAEAATTDSEEQDSEEGVSVVEGMVEEISEVVVDTSVDAESDTEEAASEINNPATDETLDEDFDPEIVEIFVEEAEEVVAAINEFLPVWKQDVSNEEARSTIRRAFHTLKGSGRMVGASDVAELAWSIENMLNRVLDGSVTMNQQRFDLITETTDKVPALITAFEQHQPVDKEPLQVLMARADALSLANDVEALDDAEKDEANVDEEPSPAIDAAEISLPVIDNLNSLSELDDELDSELLEIFAAETTVHGEVLARFIAHCKELAGPAELSDDVQRALHTMKGSANMAGITPVAMVVTPLEYVVKELRASQLKVDQPLVALLERGADLIQAGIDQLETTPLKTLDGAETYTEDLLAVFNQRIALAGDVEAEENSIAPEALNLFLTESLDLITEISGKLVLWQQGDCESVSNHEFEALMDRFISHADSVNMLAPVDFGQAVQVFYQRAAANKGVITEEFFTLANAANDGLIDMLDQIAGHQTPVFDQQLLNHLQDFEFASIAEPDLLVEIADRDDGSSAEEIGLEEDDLDVESEVTVIEPINADHDITTAMSELADAVTDSEEVELAAEPASQPTPQAITSADEADDFDEEIIEIFIEEADDLLENLDEAIHGWSMDRGNRSYLDDLLRILHTLKGGARLAGLTTMGDISHDFETSLISLEGRTEDVDDEALASIQNYQDQLLTQINLIKSGDHLASVAPLVAAPLVTAEPHSEELLGGPELDHEAVTEQPESNLDIGPDLDLEHQPDQVDSVNSMGISDDHALVNMDDLAEKSADVVPFKGTQLRQVSAAEIPNKLVDPDAKKGPQEVVKVSAQLLEELVNLAGETSISRGRAEEQVSELVFSLDEMQITVDRLQEQVRRLDMETEQQILYRQEQVESEGLEGFDPLEMDRYSQLQQLSRSLLESSSDLIDIKSTLSEKSRDMETLLVQQSRINTDLQEGLMRSRMVPFSRMVPRLRRIIRQVSGELNKRVDFHLDNIEGELDRTVLERMVAPLEHMLRNAVDHGIESIEQRMAANKPDRGSIRLDLAREGGEIVITLSDDGAGIDLAAVKNKAIERGLMVAKADLTHHEIMQFILQPGFSTASEVTQISGRGVGMDVVHSEIKQLGGSMDIDSVPGRGSKFIVRLPFTVSVNRALMVSVGGDSYAIPLNTIEGIVRVSPFELEAYYHPDAPMFEYAGQSYLLRYMGALLHRGEKPILEGQSMPLPVILVRGAEHTVAVQVDSLMGSREIVVKPLGPQFSTVQGLSGATVLGDGSVVVILDLLALIRADASLMYRDFILSTDDNSNQHRSLLVMVVDDSVTVRKVTSRFLERQGMEVILAKDGVDAITQLQEIERIPDVMLLDIEMPRMDGFEVANRMRHSARLKNIPIIMITSRTGDKHRERALSLGVNEYMGKPYQEVLLLNTINALAGITTE
ncbi:MAG: Hpt domain-containing protein [Spongiibacteraceae bacterium]